MAARWFAFVVWAAVGFTLSAWLVQGLWKPSPIPVHARPVDASASMRGDMARVLGHSMDDSEAGAGAAPAALSRFKLVGVVADPVRDDARAALALIAVDDRPPRAYRVGMAVDESWSVRAVRPRAVELGPANGPAAAMLELPPLPAAATGTLPPAQSLPSPQVAAPPPPVPAPPPAQAPAEPEAAPEPTAPAGAAPAVPVSSNPAVSMRQ
jgi:general secretion pathway protein C